ncbi:NUDIX domain-containing protein [Hasllibacter sp. MH4015]|uniref:NUDIX domain-containing protein n=1 Tax=Hasllibacter sp. MH4015 TaxID=2854029 RepID=UPI001CD242A0|nr:NUDIX domain-containing protein [Hasllibacter sp. MH4015]
MDKACPVVPRGDGTILAFRHPQAGSQFVKGTVEAGETGPHAARRELAEESGLDLVPLTSLGRSDAIEDGQIWHFWPMDAPDERFDRWDHPAPDDGGHLFSVFWQALSGPLSAEFAPTFRRAATHIEAVLK